MNLSAAPRRLGLMGGTFDPVHHGHLWAAEDSRLRFGLDAVVFLPCGQAPHRPDEAITPAEHRYAMAVLATAGNPYFAVSRTEIERPGPSYTIDTVREYRAHHGPGTELFFITGADAVLQILSWHEPEALLRECRLIAVARPGHDLSLLADHLGADRAARIAVVDMRSLDISSTEIRQRVAAGLSVRYLTPDPVCDYIAKHSLYRPGPAPGPVAAAAGGAEDRAR